MDTLWRVHPADPPRARALAAALGLHPITAQLLLNRGVADAASAARFLRPGLEALGDPLALPGMIEGLARICVDRTRPVSRRG
jgi:single-stranded-DNA-specific exonuclease